MRSELRRLRSIAQRRGLCQVHMERLTCGCTRRFRWVGTEAEWHELQQYFARIDPLVEPIFTHGGCPTCGIERYCERCGKARLSEGPNPFTQPDMERILTLLALLVREPPTP